MSEGAREDGSEDASGTPVLEIRGPRARIRLNRPDKLNRIEPEDLEVLESHLDAVEADAAVRVLVVTGTGRVFSAGYHLGDLESRRVGAGAAEGAADRFEAVANRLERCRVPNICALNGSVYGGGTDLALACDFRIGLLGSELRMPASRLGVHYYRGGMERYVSRLGLGAAKRLFLAAQPIDAAEMVRIGYLDEAVPLDGLADRVDALAGALCANAPLSVQHMKRALNDIAASRLDAEAFAVGYRACMDSADLDEGIAAWKERREPIFYGR
jgi:enoyl-CoA hydratase/carnithine racemase